MGVLPQAETVDSTLGALHERGGHRRNNRDRVTPKIPPYRPIDPSTATRPEPESRQTLTDPEMEAIGDPAVDQIFHDDTTRRWVTHKRPEFRSRRGDH